MRTERQDASARRGGPEPRRSRMAPSGTRRRGDARLPGEGDVLAGYRLVRLLGRGDHAEVHLARPQRPAADDAGGPPNVALKIVPAERRTAAEAEILALHAVSSEHVVRLVDVASLADGSMCLVQSLGARGTAASLVRRRGRLTSGEIVTLIASVLRGAGDLHAAGFAHGSLDLTHVVIDQDGRPVLCGLGAARSLDGPARWTDDDPVGGGDPVAQDLARIGRLVGALREPRDDAGRASGARWDDWLAQLDEAVHRESTLSAHDLAELLLDVADAAPLADSPTTDEHDAPLGDADLRIRATGPAAHPRSDRRAGRHRPGRAERTGGAERGGRIRRHRAEAPAPVARAVGGLSTARTRLRGELATVRPRVWALGTTALVAIVAGACVLPALDDAAHGAASTGPTSSTAGEAATGAPEVAASGEASPTPAEPSPDPASTADADADADAASIVSDDADAAAPALLRERARCLRSGDDRCLAGVDQEGSAAEDADRALRAGAPDALTDAALHVLDGIDRSQRLGDTALVTLDPAPAGAAPDAERRPASVLLVRTEAGWRIRDLMDDR